MRRYCYRCDPRNLTWPMAKSRLENSTTIGSCTHDLFVDYAGRDSIKLNTGDLAVDFINDYFNYIKRR